MSRARKNMVVVVELYEGDLHDIRTGHPGLIFVVYDRYKIETAMQDGETEEQALIDNCEIWDDLSEHSDYDENVIFDALKGKLKVN